MSIERSNEIIRILNGFDEAYELPYYTKINGEIVSRRFRSSGPERNGYLKFWRDMNCEHAQKHGGKPLIRPSYFYNPEEL